MTSSPHLSGQERYGSGDDIVSQAGVSQGSDLQSCADQRGGFVYEADPQAQVGHMPQDSYPQESYPQDSYLQGAYVGQAQQGQSYQQPYRGQSYQQGYQQAYPQPYQGQPYSQAYPQPYQGGYVQPGAVLKSKAVAGLLAIFLGCLGIHNFYVGRTGRGVAQLLITLLSLGALIWVPWIWAIIEGILILSSRPGQLPWGVDAYGYPLQP